MGSPTDGQSGLAGRRWGGRKENRHGWLNRVWCRRVGRLSGRTRDCSKRLRNAAARPPLPLQERESRYRASPPSRGITGSISVLNTAPGGNLRGGATLDADYTVPATFRMRSTSWGTDGAGRAGSAGIERDATSTQCREPPAHRARPGMSRHRREPPLGTLQAGGHRFDPGTLHSRTRPQLAALPARCPSAGQKASARWRGTTA
jgi:hypothetical protein